MADRRTYRTGLTDSSRWDAVVLRDDDVILSVPSKCGTTWLQMVVALLVFGGPDLPAPLTELSPWVDMRLRPVEDLVAQLEAQEHRRLLKTHTPLDGLPHRDGITYVVCGRDRDVAVSMAHHRANLNPEVIAGARRTMDGWPTIGDRVRGWLEDDRPVAGNLSSLRGTVWHLAGAWARRSDPSVVLAHYADLLEDLPASMRRLAATLGIDVPATAWPALVAAASFDGMRADAARIAPHEGLGLLVADEAFFRSGRSGSWREAFGPAELATYESRMATVPADLRAWLER